ncbi:TPA: hypothetical protein ACSPZY_004014, partial [Aeromonas veronii]
EYGSATAQIANAVIAGHTVSVPTTFLQNAQVTAASVTTNNAVADSTTANVITLTLKDKDGNAVPAGTPVKLSYAIATTPAFTPIITPANNTIATVNASGQVAVNIRSSTVGSVTLTNPAVVGGLPLVATSAQANFVRSLAPFIRPTTSTYTWSTADAYCRGLSPAARLPTRQELMDLFIDATSATEPSAFNPIYEMCDIYGWPMQGGRCGGTYNNYWTSDTHGTLFGGVGGHHWTVLMHYGFGVRSNNLEPYQVVCVR